MAVSDTGSGTLPAVRLLQPRAINLSRPQRTYLFEPLAKLEVVLEATLDELVHRDDLVHALALESALQLHYTGLHEVEW